MLLTSEAARAQTEACSSGLDLGEGAGLDHGDAAVPGPGAWPHVVTLIHEELVLDQNPPSVLELIVLLLVAPLEVVHVQEDNLNGCGHSALLLDRPELLGGGGDSLDALMKDSHLSLETPEHLSGVCLVTQSAERDRESVTMMGTTLQFYRHKD